MDEQLDAEMQREAEQRSGILQAPSERAFDDQRKHLPFTTQYDEVVDHSAVRTDKYRALTQEVREAINRLTSELEDVLVVRDDIHTQIETEEGSVWTEGLYNMLVDKNYRTPFKQLISGESRDVAIQLVIDLSGSMSEARMRNAAIPLAVAQKLVAAIAEALARLDLDCEVVGYNTGNMPLEAILALEQDPYAARYNRTSHRVVNHVFKPFGSNNREPIAAMQAAGSNCDGESLRWAAKRLEAHTAKRKIMMVFSDGMPRFGGNTNIGNSDLRRAVKEISDTGVEVVGFGIHTDAVTHFYPDHVVVASLDELMGKAMSKLKSLLAE
jgi:cobaltochelatase CobT